MGCVGTTNLLIVLPVVCNRANQASMAGHVLNELLRPCMMRFKNKPCYANKESMHAMFRQGGVLLEPTLLRP
jgi:hypothetical protein